MRVPCRACGKRVETREDVPLPPYFPFCSERCRLVDLGKWFNEEFRVGRAVEPKDLGADPDEGMRGD